MKMTLLKFFLICTFKEPNLAEKRTNLAGNLWKSWTPRSSWSLFFPSLFLNLEWQSSYSKSHFPTLTFDQCLHVVSVTLSWVSCLEVWRRLFWLVLNSESFFMPWMNTKYHDMFCPCKTFHHQILSGLQEKLEASVSKAKTVTSYNLFPRAIRATN